jgi:hypothetical protein
MPDAGQCTNPEVVSDNLVITKVDVTRLYPLFTAAGFGAALAANHALVPHGVRVLSSEARDDDRVALLTTVSSGFRAFSHSPE